MLRQMTALEFDEWVAYSSLEPFGPLVDDLHFAKSMALTASIYAKKGRRYAPKDFMLATPMKRPVRRQTPEEMLAAAEQINRALGGKDLRRG
jgi:hypothetical protein